MPEQWRALDIRLRYRGSSVRVRVEPEGVEVRADPPASVTIAGADPVVARPTGIRWRLVEGRWKEAQP
jgi:hypothetical protein